METTNINIQAAADTQTGQDIKHAVLVTSIVINLAVLVSWVTLQVVQYV